jgi:lipopolysaccharide transport system ATP-binding protein
MSSIITVENLSKRYRIGAITNGSLRESIVHKWGNLTGNKKNTEEEFWALRNVSFEVGEGEAIGIIGKNGAGKSTLLKILSRITEPTSGTIRINGRISSLLEVGTGFHPELTGRENIFLNGTILGMTRREVKSKFDEIVAFSGVEKFIDTSVKHYSSGMYVRLAFAVAAHLEPEILIIDEVLAVGDAEFQKKCLGKMDEVAKGGRTVLFVSHNMGAVNSLCTKSLLLHNGMIVVYDKTPEVILKYYSNDSNTAFFEPGNRKVGDEKIELIKTWIESSGGNTQNTFHLNEDFYICMKYKVLKESTSIPVPNFHFYYTDGSYAFVCQPPDEKEKEPGTYFVKCKIPRFFLNNRTYFVGVAVTTYHEVGYDVNFFEQNALSFIIKDEMNYAEMNRYNYNSEVPGVVRPLLHWENIKI